MSSLSPLIIANWKMNLTLAEADKACNILSSTSQASLLIAPPTPYIAYLKARQENLNFCAQDVSVKNDFGSYTGENSAQFFKSCNVNYAIIGHSERRNLFGENNEIVRQKVWNCINNGITPIVCIGESLELRENGKYKKFLMEQLAGCFIRHCEPSKMARQSQEAWSNTSGDCLVASAPRNDVVIIAYEPIWSIGTKITPKENEIAEIFDLIKNSDTILDYQVQLVYGGSVNSENIKDFLRIPNIAGLLIGGASLNTQELLKILNS